MQTATIVQEVPIQVISAAQLSNLKEPPLPNPEVYILMPQLKLVQRVVDRMKNVSATLKIEANMAGTLKLSVCNEATNISTLFHNLEHPQIGKNNTAFSRVTKLFQRTQFHLVLLTSKQKYPST